MTATTLVPAATTLADFKAQAAELAGFDEDVLRNSLIRAAGDKLSLVSESSSQTIRSQITTIRDSVAEFNSILERMHLVQSNVQQIDANVNTVVRAAQGSAEELALVSQRMRELEENISAIDGLVRAVNEIADQTHLLSLNASIEAARAGDAGRGFGVVAGEVKELASTTKTANQQIQETLDSIASAVSSLSESVSASVEKMEQSVAAVEVTRESAAAIGHETTNFGRQLEQSQRNFFELDESSRLVENEVREIDVIGKTFSYLLELMAMQGVGSQSIDPLERLLPLVHASGFEELQRFTQSEPEYVLRADDILVSATDTRGIITFANNCFCRIAEFELDELVGQPHNIIRHPDMPRTAFADLWAMIQGGKLWQGYVANRSKYGRLYWVKANVFPCYEQDQIVGYISIRTKPEPQQIKQAMEAYRLVP